MKTFSEACKVVFLSRRSEEDSLEAQKRLVDAQLKRASLIDEVVDSHEARFLIQGILAHQSENIPECMANIFAQGVLVGMEMEREEIKSEISAGDSSEN